MDFDYREDTEGTVDTWEILDQQRGDAPGNFQVPPGAKALTKLTFHVAPDFGAAAAILRLATVFRLTGNALRTEHKPYLFPGCGGGVAITTSGMVASTPIGEKVSYSPTPPIPLAESGTEFTIEGKFVGEDSGDVSFLAEVEYDGPGGGIPFLAADVREDDLADATEALVLIDTEVTADTTNAASNFLPPPGVNKLAYAVYHVGLDVASATRYAHQFEIDGDGLKAERKPKRWAGWSGFQGLVTSGGVAVVAPPEVKTLDQELNKNFRVTVRAGMIEEDYGAGTVVMGLLYL